MGYTPELVEARLIDAAKTLARMPRNRRPSAARDPMWQDSSPRDSDRCCVKGVPLPAQITRMDEAQTWLKLIGNEAARRIVMARSLGATWRRLEALDGRCHVTLRNVYRKALVEIAGELNLRYSAVVASPGENQ